MLNKNLPGSYQHGISNDEPNPTHQLTNLTHRLSRSDQPNPTHQLTKPIYQHVSEVTTQSDQPGSCDDPILENSVTRRSRIAIRGLNRRRTLYIQLRVTMNGVFNIMRGSYNILALQFWHTRLCYDAAQGLCGQGLQLFC